MTHIEYPYIEDYIELFVEIYNEMGFETTLIPTPSTRGLLLLDEGTVDADVLRLSYTAKNYSLPNIPDMLKANRYKYALFLLDDLMERQFKTDFQSVKIKSMAIYHVVHKKHIALIPQIEEKIRTKLPEFLRKRGMRTIL